MFGDDTMQCKYLKRKINKKLECKLDKNKIIPNDCANCNFKTWKCTELKRNCAKYRFPDVGKVLKSPLKTVRLHTKPDYKMKQKSNKLANLERKRFSLFTDNLTKCYFCSNKKNHMHEIYSGCRRQTSMKYGLCLPICESCHSKYQNNKIFNDFWHKKGQVIFETIYPDLNFIDIFGKNYK